jgi:hypothetical protein
MDTKVSLHDGDGTDNSTSGIEEAAEARRGRSNPTRIRNENLHLLLVSSHIRIPNDPKSSYHQRKATSKGRRFRIMRKDKKQQDKILMIQLEAKKEIVTKTTKTESDPQGHHPR